MIRQADYDLVDPSNIGRQLSNLGGQLPNSSGELADLCCNSAEFGRMHFHPLEQFAQRKGATQHKKRNRNGDPDQCVCLRFHAIQYS